MASSRITTAQMAEAIRAAQQARKGKRLARRRDLEVLTINALRQDLRDLKRKGKQA